MRILLRSVLNESNLPVHKLRANIIWNILFVQVKQKKWKERVDLQDKMKEQKQAKRQENLQKRKDEKVKRIKKIQRKKGRIA